MRLNPKSSTDSEALRQQLAQMQEALRLAVQERDAVVTERNSIRQERDALQGETRVLKVERDLLKERLSAFIRKLFAAKSEARGRDQKDLFFDEAEALSLANTEPATEEPVADAGVIGGTAADSIEVPAHQRAKRGRKPLDPALPRDVTRIELPESERICAHDGSALIEIGVEASERIHIIPQEVRVARTDRVKYACPCCDLSLRVAPAPARLIPKGLYTESAMAWIITAKYQDGMPLYRTAAILGRFGGTDQSRNTMAVTVVRAGDATQPVINLMRDHLLEANVIYGDETEVQVLREPGRPASSKSYMWVQMSGTGPPIRIFNYLPSRSAASAATLYAGIKPGAVLMTDGYEAYSSIAQVNGLVHLACWAHVRRRFVDAEAAIPKAQRRPDQPATQFIAAIASLYAVEAKARDLSVEERQRLRQQHSKPVLEKIESLLQTHLHNVVPNSEFGKALHYLAGQWPKLIRFVDDGSYPIDNNPCENAIRPFVIGRKNWLHSDSVGGAKASANLYSLIETCKANRIDAYQYLCALFTALPNANTADDYEALLPWRIKLPPQ